nr:putative reverse transcriptase, RNA-dependent DNA polymerase, Gag-polypeptide of LTR copia-type [Tanacetum cinerariifolium]
MKILLLEAKARKKSSMSATCSHAHIMSTSTHTLALAGGLSRSSLTTIGIMRGKEFNYDVEELPINTLRRSSRQTQLPNSLNGFIVEGKVKYGVKRVVNYANLNHENFCFVSGLNKSVEHVIKKLF